MKQTSKCDEMGSYLSEKDLGGSILEVPVEFINISINRLFLDVLEIGLVSVGCIQPCRCPLHLILFVFQIV